MDFLNQLFEMVCGHFRGFGAGLGGVALIVLFMLGINESEEQRKKNDK